MSDAERVASAINHWARGGLEMLGSTDKDAFNRLLLDYFDSPDEEPEINRFSDGKL